MQCTLQFSNFLCQSAIHRLATRQFKPIAGALYVSCTPDFRNLVRPCHSRLSCFWSSSICDSHSKVSLEFSKKIIYILLIAWSKHLDLDRENINIFQTKRSIAKKTLNYTTLQIFIVILLHESIKVMEKMYILMIGKLFCKNYHWNPGVVKQL